MRFLRPFDRSHGGAAAEWLVPPEERIGCTIRVCRRGWVTAPEVDKAADRFLYVLAGTVDLITGEGSATARPGDLVFLPAGAHARAEGGDTTVWVEARGLLPEGAGPDPAATARVIAVDPTKFEGQGFAYQSLVDRTGGAQAMRMNVLQVQPGSGSPDWHIHAFTQMYVITEGEMTVDIGRRRQVAGPGTLVIFPAGVVHRNFNAGVSVERHVTFLVPEPGEGEIFDYAITIHDEEAKIMTSLPA